MRTADTFGRIVLEGSVGALNGSWGHGPGWGRWHERPPVP